MRPTSPAAFPLPVPLLVVLALASASGCGVAPEDATKAPGDGEDSECSDGPQEDGGDGPQEAGGDGPQEAGGDGQEGDGGDGPQEAGAAVVPTEDNAAYKEDPFGDDQAPIWDQVIIVQDGALAGAAAAVPAGALPEGVVVSLSAGEHEDVDGATPLGPAVKLEPSGTRFDEAVWVRLPFDPAPLGEDWEPEQLVVVKKDGETGEIRILASGEVDLEAGTLVFGTTRFSSAWPAKINWAAVDCSKYDDGSEDDDTLATASVARYPARRMRSVTTGKWFNATPRGMDRWVGEPPGGYVLCKGDDDWRGFNPSTRYRLSTWVEKTAVGVTPKLKLIDKAGNVLPALASVGPRRTSRRELTWVQDADQVMYRRVFSVSLGGRKPGKYKASYRVLGIGPKPEDSCNEPTSPAGDSAGQGMYLCDLNSTTAKIRTCPGGDDWYRMRAPGFKTVEVVAAYDPKDGEPEIDLLLNGQLVSTGVTRRSHVKRGGDELHRLWTTPTGPTHDYHVRVRSLDVFDAKKAGIQYTL